MRARRERDEYVLLRVGGIGVDMLHDPDGTILKVRRNDRIALRDRYAVRDFGLSLTSLTGGDYSSAIDRDRRLYAWREQFIRQCLVRLRLYDLADHEAA